METDTLLYTEESVLVLPKNAEKKYPLKDIAEITGLSIDRIQALREKQGK